MGKSDSEQIYPIPRTLGVRLVRVEGGKKFQIKTSIYYCRL